MMDAVKQVDIEHYQFDKYVHVPRWNSYWYQLKETFEAKPATVLTIGDGDGIVSDLLRRQGITVKTFDIDPEIKPDFVGSIGDLKNILQGETFDVILCCQVLEHLPFENFEPILQQLRDSFNKRLIVSLPFGGHRLEFLLSIPKLIIRKKTWYVDRKSREYKFNGEHYWEVGYKGCSQKTIKNVMTRNFKLLRSYSVPFNAKHVFYILEK